MSLRKVQLEINKLIDENYEFKDNSIREIMENIRGNPKAMKEVARFARNLKSQHRCSS